MSRTPRPTAGDTRIAAAVRKGFAALDGNPNYVRCGRCKSLVSVAAVHAGAVDAHLGGHAYFDRRAELAAGVL